MYRRRPIGLGIATLCPPMTDSAPEKPQLNEQQVRHVARLARLSLSEDELTAIAADLDAVVRFVDRLAKVDVQGLEPMASPHGHSSRLHPDEPIAPLSQETVIGAAPEHQGDYIAVPKVLDQGADA